MTDSEKPSSAAKPDQTNQPVAPWHSTSVAEVLALLQTSATGLSGNDVKERLGKYGPNALRDVKAVSRWIVLGRQFANLIVWVLIVAGGVSLVLGEWLDGGIILAVVVINAAIGFFQEDSAERALQALRKMSAPMVKVRRDGAVVSLPAADLVPGDVVELEAGDLIPADLRLLSAASLSCAEAALTGESEAVTKQVDKLPAVDADLGDRDTCAFMSTVVTTGTGQGVVVATGMASEIGKIAGLLTGAAEDATPLQRQLTAFGKLLVWLSLGIVVILFGLGLLRGHGLLELFMTSVSLAVAAVPEGLPAIVTLALALGVQRMAGRRALVRRLPAVETLGSCSVICTDKTGTLTRGEMTVRALWTMAGSATVTGEGYAPTGEIQVATGDAVSPQAQAASPLAKDLLTVFVGCTNAHVAHEGDAWTAIGDPTEAALLVVGTKGGIEIAALDQQTPRVAELPFDSQRKLMTVIRRAPAGPLALVKGAPDVLLERCTHVLTSEGERPLIDADRERIQTAAAEMAARALRVLGAARRVLADDRAQPDSPDLVERDLVFVGLSGMQDPPRPEAKAAIAKCRAAGIQVVMITGDHPVTARAIAEELGLLDADSKVLTGHDVAAMDDPALVAAVPQVAVYARTTAEHKLRIVRAWKTNGAVVAMTGDGVNDAPAIKGADIGVAMGRGGTEVTKASADLVITDDDFTTIVAAVEEGRGIYDNIRKTIAYLLAGNAGELLLMAVCVIVGMPLPLLPVHLLWINLVTDGLPALCLASDPIDPAVMAQRPRAAGASLINRRFLLLTLGTGMLTALVSFAVFWNALQHESVETARTHAFSVLVFAELLRSFGARSDTRFLWEIGLGTNLRLLAVVVLSIALQIASHHIDWLGQILRTTHVPLIDCFTLLLIGAIPLVVLEFSKIWLRRSPANA